MIERKDIHIPPEGVQFSQKAAEEFWRVWKEVGEPHKHGFYESTWMAIWAALRVEPEKKDKMIGPSMPMPKAGY